MHASAHDFEHVTNTFGSNFPSVFWLAKQRMSSRSRSPVLGRQLALFPGSRTMRCPCVPCPWCILELSHDSSIEDAKVIVRDRMTAWGETGCSAFQAAVTVFVFEWILKHHEQRPYGRVLALDEIALISGRAVRPCTEQFRHFALTMAIWADAPPPPPPGLPAGGSSSSSGPSAVTGASAAWLGATPPGSAWREPGRSGNSDDEWQGQFGPEVHPHFQWQAGTSKKVWRSFEEPWQTQLREAYNSDQNTLMIKWEDDEVPDTFINFVNMDQENQETYYRRKIRIKPQ
jgi:hypothetical protein